MAVSSRRIVGSRVIDLDFDVRQDSTVTLDAVAEVFQALTKSLHTIQVIGLSPVAPMIRRSWNLKSSTCSTPAP